MFESFPTISCCSRKFPPNEVKKLADWMCEVVSGIAYIGWVVGNGLAGKVLVQNCGRALAKPKNQPGWGCAGSLMAGMKHSLHCGHSGCLKAATLDIARHLPVPEAAIRIFHISVNSPLLQSASSKSTKV